MSISSRTRAYYVLTLIITLYIFDYADRLVITSFLDSIKQEWHLSDVKLGMLTSIVNLFVALFVLPFSIIVDRWSRKKMIALMGIVWSLASLGCAFAANYNQLLIMRAITGLGEAAYATAAVALISKIFPRDKRAQHIGIYYAAAPLGAGLGIIVGGIIAATLGWRYGFGLVALPGLVVAFLFFTVRDYATLPLEEQKSEPHKKNIELFISIRNIIRVKTLWFVIIAFALVIGVNTSVIDWITTYFMRYYELDQKLASTLSGAMAILIIVGAPLGGIIGDRWQRSNKNAYMYLSGYSTILCAVSLTFALVVNNIGWCIAFFALFGVSSMVFIAPATAVIQNVVQPGIRAVAYGFNVMVENLLGAFLFPVLVGKFSDVVGLRLSLSMLPFVAIIASILFFAGARIYQQDMTRS
jgi:MFS family permease